MNFKPWSKKESIYDEPIDKLREELRQYDPNSDEFRNALTQLERLTKLKSANRGWKSKVSPDTIVLGAVHIIGILAIVAYEQHGHAMTSKAMNHIKPPSLK